MRKEPIMNSKSSAPVAKWNIRWTWLWLIPVALCLFLQALAQDHTTPAQLPAPLSTEPQPEWNVLYGHPGFKDAEKMLSEYLTRALGKIAEDREKVIAGLKSVAAFERYRSATGGKLETVLGAFLARTPLNTKIVGRLERGDYVAEKIIFESRPNYYVTANAYVPGRARPPFPAVLCPVGHWGAGKAFEDYQRLAIHLAQHGFLSLVYDLSGQGERQQYYNQVLGRSLLSPDNSEYFVTIEHGVAAGQTILTSGNLVAYLVWDGLRALDYLCERQDVDRERIACTGTSGGGLQTELLSALDQRIKVSIPVCYGGCSADVPTRPGLSLVDVETLIAPRPLLMIEATGDPRAEVLAKQVRHQVVAGAYQLLGAGERTQFVITEGRHGYTESMREAACAWLTRWLGPSLPATANHVEQPTAIEAESALFCTTTGQVKTALGGETIFSLNRAEAGRVSVREPPPARRKEWAEWRQHLCEKVRSRIACSGISSPANPLRLSRVDKGSYKLEKVVYYSEPEIFIPALLLLPKSNLQPAPAVVFVNEGGKSSDGLVENYLSPLAEQGYVVLSIDPRGMGETAPPTAHPYDQRDYRGFAEDVEADLFYDALSAGKTLVGMRTWDVLRGVDYLQSRTEVDPKRIAAIGQGMGGLLVMFAAALDERIQSVACASTLVSYSAVVESEIYTQRFSAFAPSLLRDFDLADVAALIAPRLLLLLNSMDPSHGRVTLDRATETYRVTSATYRLLGASQNFAVVHRDSAKEIAESYVELLSQQSH
jgi:cephalosporin-C deacetylase-like acetyl esterase